MDADAHARELGVRGMGPLQAQGERGPGAGGVEGQEEAVAGGVDLAALCLVRQPAHQPLMARDQGARRAIAEAALETRRVDQVGEDERNDARSALCRGVGHLGFGLGCPGRILMAPNGDAMAQG
jgi:hypothetical protein